MAMLEFDFGQVVEAWREYRESGEIAFAHSL
jgi:hypothetical protein